MATRICLNMIVKDEAAIIEQCLQALAPAIDCYVICDTGSTDDTVNLIRGVFDPLDIPGEIVHTEFVDFGQARNFALDTARASRWSSTTSCCAMRTCNSSSPTPTGKTPLSRRHTNSFREQWLGANIPTFDLYIALTRLAMSE